MSKVIHDYNMTCIESDNCLPNRLGIERKFMTFMRLLTPNVIRKEPEI